MAHGTYGACHGAANDTCNATALALSSNHGTAMHEESRICIFFLSNNVYVLFHGQIQELKSLFIGFGAIFLF